MYTLWMYVCSKDSINWMKYYNFITTKNTHIYEEWTILRKWMEIKINIFFLKLNKRIKRLMRKRKKGSSEAQVI